MKNKFLQIWALAISALWIISLSGSKINNSKIEEDFKLINSSFADDENDDYEDEDETSNLIDSILNDRTISNSWVINSWTTDQPTTSKLFKAPNGKVYSIIDNWEIVRIKKWDQTYAKIDFSSSDEAISYLNQNAIPAPEVYKAPNGKNYTIMFENWKIVVKKSDWSYAKQTFTSYAEAKTYLDKNAPKVVVVIKPIIKKTVAKKTTTLNTNVTKTVVAKPVVTATKPVVTKPVVSTPKVDTTTKAS